MGRQTGFEPATPGTTNQCSNQLSYYRHKELTKLRNHIESSTGKVYSQNSSILVDRTDRLRHDNKLLFFVMLQAGLVGLPNVGKSTLFNALTKTRKAEAANYPFCTIDPNVGVVQVPDARLTPLAELVSTTTLIPAAIEMVDIAGLVEGASKGEGLGNKFLANVREVDAIVHVVRCFEDEDVIHNMGRVDPVADAEVIMTELILADAESVASQLQKNQKKARGQDKDAAANVALLEKLVPHLDEGKPANLLSMDEDESERLKTFHLLSSCLLYTSPSPRDATLSRMPSSA